MRRAYRSGAGSAVPAAALQSSEGNPQEVGVNGATESTIPGARYFYMLTEAVVSVIEDAGLAPDDDPNQFRDAVRAVIDARIGDAVSGLVDTAPGALDTLNELAAALGDDPNFSATITAMINARLTQDQVDARIEAAAKGGITGPADAKAANYAVAANDDGKTIEVDATGGARTVTLPDLAAADDGFTVTVIKTDNSGNAVTVDGDGADTINGDATYELKSRWEGVILKWAGAEWLAIGGASTSWLRDFFGAASSQEITASGPFSWPYDTPKCIAVIDGAGGGGGGAGNSGAASRGGNGGDRPGGAGVQRAAGDSAGSGGDAGGDTSLEVNGTTYTARGGGGGAGGSGGYFGGGHYPHHARGDGGDGVFPGYTGNRAVQATYFGHGGPSGSAENGGDGGVQPQDDYDGGAGGAGERKVVQLTGLARGTQLNITIGAGGAAGRGGKHDAPRDGDDGGSGKVTLVPLY